MKSKHSPAIRYKNRIAIISIAGGALWACAAGVFSQNLAPVEPARQPSARLGRFSLAGGGEPPAPWRVVGVPRSDKPLTRYDIISLDGRQVLRVRTDRSYANLVHDLPPSALEPGVRLRWRWRLDAPLPGADLMRRDGDDSPLKVCAMFDLPLERLGFVERSLLRTARALSGEPLPAATLCYVWDSKLPNGTLLRNAYTDRVRMIVLDSGEAGLGQWVGHSQDVAADFKRAFGEESPVPPPLTGVLVGADSDNTAGSSLGYVGDITLEP